MISEAFQVRSYGAVKLFTCGLAILCMQSPAGAVKLLPPQVVMRLSELVVKGTATFAGTSGVIAVRRVIQGNASASVKVRFVMHCEDHAGACNPISRVWRESGTFYLTPDPGKTSSYQIMMFVRSRSASAK